MPKQVSCGEAVIKLLERYGVDTAFGIPGEHTLDLYRGFVDSNIRHVLVRNEQGAGFMADGYARASGRPGVCTLITGPGVTNAATPLGQAYADSIPVLLISAANARETHGKGWGCLHEISDQRAVTAPLTAFSAMASSPDDIPELIGQAFTVFASRRPRPVHISIPVDVLAMRVDDDWEPRIPPARPVPAPDAIAAAVDLLARAQRPVLVVGGGAVDAGATVREIAEWLDATVIASNAGKGVVPDSHPLSLGGGLIRAPVRDHLATADVILSIGSELSETDSFVDRLPINGKLIRIDIDAAKFNDIYPADIGVLSDAAAAVTAILSGLRRQGDDCGRTAMAAELETVRRAVVDDLSPVEAQHKALFDGLRSLLPAETIIMGDIAQLVYTGSAVMPVELPRRWFYPAGFGTLGCALPGAIGAKLAMPDLPVVALVGDGGFMFTVQELMTAIETKLTIPIIIWNNDSLAMIRDGFDLRGIPRIGVNQLNPDFVKLAEAFGCAGERVENRDDFNNAVTRALAAQGPTVIEVREGASWLR
jgi:5-guanidino-2-oxopentanoate decarboxylase